MGPPFFRTGLLGANLGWDELIPLAALQSLFMAITFDLR